MNQLDGYQVTLDAMIGTEEHVFVLDGVPKAKADRLVSYWHRPAWLRFGVVLVSGEDGEPIAISWRDIVGLWIQPQMEVIT